MAKKKKRTFIDKKQAETFHLVRRSQRDVGGYFDEETGEPLAIPKEFVLLPDSASPKNSTATTTAATTATTRRTNNDENDNGVDPMIRARNTLASAGLLDEYDYSRHIKPITGSGTFVPPPSTNLRGLPRPPPTSVSHARNRDVPLDEPGVGPTPLAGFGGDHTVQELDRRLDAIALSAGCMDDDIAQALFGDFEEGAFEEILDDFCTAADAAPLEELVEERDEKKVTSASHPDFDFDAHAKMLIERARREDASGKRTVVPSGKGVNEWWDKQESVFEGVAPRRGKHQEDESDEEEEEDGSVDSWDEEFGRPDDPNDGSLGRPSPLDLPPPTTTTTTPSHQTLTAEQEKILADKFAETLLEYDSDELGDLDEQYREIAGTRPIQGDNYIDLAVNEFLRDQDDGIYRDTDGKDDERMKKDALMKRTGGSSNVLVDGRLVAPSSSAVHEANVRELAEEEKFESVLREADETLAMGKADVPPEEILIDGKSYFDMKEQNPWDCESILSTYSNLDNNPAVIGSSRRRKKGKKKNKVGSAGAGAGMGGDGQIRLSDKTGLPIEEEDDEDASYLDNDYYGEDQTCQSVNLGVARNKNETKEEKRARKLQVKQEREIARLQKKMVREAIADEFQKREGNVLANDVAGKSVFRF